MSDFRVRVPFATRWRDNDQYGHLNNVVYYEAMDTAVNRWMIDNAGLQPRGGDLIALCVASSCEYRRSAAFPDELVVAIGIERLGETSITWTLDILLAGSDEQLATGRFVHVFVDAGDRRPRAVPASVRAAIAAHTG